MREIVREISRARDIECESERQRVRVRERERVYRFVDVMYYQAGVLCDCVCVDRP